MADRGIIFSAPMVKALLAGRKLQTRRLVAHPEYWGCPTGDCPHSYQSECDAAMQALAGEIVPWAAGDRTYVRETCRATELILGGEDGIRYEADDKWISIPSDPEAVKRWLKLFNYSGKAGEPHLGLEFRGPLVPSIHQPRWASRLWLSVMDVRVQRLQDISEADAISEGIIYYEPTETDDAEFAYVEGGPIFESPRPAYAALWDTLHTEPGTRWADSPWVYALTWPEVNRGNIDA